MFGDDIVPTKSGLSRDLKIRSDPNRNKIDLQTFYLNPIRSQSKINFISIFISVVTGDYE